MLPNAGSNGWGEQPPHALARDSVFLLAGCTLRGGCLGVATSLKLLIHSFIHSLVGGSVRTTAMSLGLHILKCHFAGLTLKKKVKSAQDTLHKK